MKKYLIIFKDSIDSHTLLALQQEDCMISSVRYSAGTYQVQVFPMGEESVAKVLENYDVELEVINDDRFSHYEAAYKFIA